MMSEGKSLLEEYPSLDLAYEQVKDVLNQQRETASSLDAKASMLIAVATAILGVGLPLGISRVMDMQDVWLYGLLLFITVIPMFVYYQLWELAVRALRLRGFITLNHPQKIREEFWHLPREDFMYDMLLHTEKAFKENDKKLKSKAETIDKLLKTTVIETSIVIVWITAVTFLTSSLS